MLEYFALSIIVVFTVAVAVSIYGVIRDRNGWRRRHHRSTNELFVWGKHTSPSESIAASVSASPSESIAASVSASPSIGYGLDGERLSEFFPCDKDGKVKVTYYVKNTWPWSKDNAWAMDGEKETIRVDASKILIKNGKAYYRMVAGHGIHEDLLV